MPTVNALREVKNEEGRRNNRSDCFLSRKKKSTSFVTPKRLTFFFDATRVDVAVLVLVALRLQPRGLELPIGRLVAPAALVVAPVPRGVVVVGGVTAVAATYDEGARNAFGHHHYEVVVLPVVRHHGVRVVAVVVVVVVVTTAPVDGGGRRRGGQEFHDCAPYLVGLFNGAVGLARAREGRAVVVVGLLQLPELPELLELFRHVVV